MMVKLATAEASDVATVLAYIAEDPEINIGAAALAAYQSRQQLWLILQNTKVVGFLAGRLTIDEAELDHILIWPDFQRLGIAKAAMQSWHDMLASAGGEKVFLEVRSENTPAIALYHTLGYRQVGRRKNYYRTEQGTFDALVLSLDLTS